MSSETCLVIWILSAYKPVDYIKISVSWLWQGSEYASAKFHRVLNMTQTLNMPRFWICHGTEYAAILNMQQLHTVLNFRECAWISINILAYVWIIVNKQASEYNVTSSACYFVALSNTENQLHALFISKTWLKLAKMKKNAKQHPEPEILALENHSDSSSTLPTKNNRTYSKN